MRIKLITLAFTPSLGGFDTRSLDGFVADKEVLAVREHFFVVHEQPFLACLVSWQELPGPGMSDKPPTACEPRGRQQTRSTGRESRDATLDLPPADRALFQTLREWRSKRAKQEGKPPYILFTNRELAAIATTRPALPGALLHIEGIGPGKVDRYGAEILALVAPPDGPDTLAARAGSSAAHSAVRSDTQAGAPDDRRTRHDVHEPSSEAAQQASSQDDRGEPLR